MTKLIVKNLLPCAYLLFCFWYDCCIFTSCCVFVKVINCGGVVWQGIQASSVMAEPRAEQASSVMAEQASSVMAEQTSSVMAEHTSSVMAEQASSVMAEPQSEKQSWTLCISGDVDRVFIVSVSKVL